MTGSTSQPLAEHRGVSPEVDYAALLPGQTIGRYEIVSVLGQGGFGITYRARDIQLGREVAIKEYLPTALARARGRHDGAAAHRPRWPTISAGAASASSTRAARWRASHRAPAIVRVFDFLEANGTAYIVMELLQRRDARGAHRSATAS